MSSIKKIGCDAEILHKKLAKLDTNYFPERNKWHLYVASQYAKICSTPELYTNVELNLFDKQVSKYMSGCNKFKKYPVLETRILSEPSAYES